MLWRRGLDGEGGKKSREVGKERGGHVAGGGEIVPSLPSSSTPSGHFIHSLSPEALAPFHR